jgi:hypothetical protein
MAHGTSANPVRRGRQRHRRSTIRILEEAVHLLRLSSVSTLICYYVGSLPFILGLLYFFSDMSRSAFAADYCGIAALGLALLYVWMKSWQSVFTDQIRHQIERKNMRGRTLSQLFILTANQSIIHASGFIVLPVALLLAIPFGWCFAFYQNATAMADRHNQDLNAVCRRAWQQALLWPRQNHMLLSIFFIFGIVVFLNLAIALYVLPHALKKFLGIDTIFTLSGINALNTTFWATTAGITYLCFDPIVKTAYTLRCYYGEAIKTGDDIRTQLKQVIHLGKALAPVILVAFTFLLLNPGPAQTSETGVIESKPGNGSISPQTLDDAIEKVLEQRAFSWRLPRDVKKQKEKENPGPIAAAIKWIMAKLDSLFDTLWQWVKDFVEWLLDLLPDKGTARDPSREGSQNTARHLLIVLLILLAAGLVLFVWRDWRRRRHQQPDNIIAQVTPAAPDITDEALKADELPVNRWLSMAQEFIGKGALRLAMRALYLATLSRLAEYDMITIEFYKSNREYERELQRRAHDRRDLLAAFAYVLAVFERVWYGMHDISRSEFDNYAATQERIMAFAEQ